MNALNEIKRLRTERAAICKQAAESMKDILDIISCNYPEDVKKRVYDIDIRISELEKEHPYKAGYYNTTLRTVGFFKTYEDAKNALAPFINDYNCVINGDYINHVSETYCEKGA